MEKALTIIEDLSIPSQYKNVLREFLTALQSFRDSIECIALVGSIARGDDFVEGWSDIDILVVTKNSGIIDKINKIAVQLNNKYPKTRKGAGILSIWIDDKDSVAKWFGRGCEYYNVVKDFILLYGNDMRMHIREPDKAEIKETLKLVVTEARKHLSKFKDDTILDNIDSLSLASYIYPLMRFYLCAKGYPTASRKKMIELLRKIESNLTRDEIDALVTVLEDLLSGKRRIDPALNRKIIKAVEKIISDIENIVACS